MWLGDLVIVIDESRKNGWVRGRVLDVTAGEDGRVYQMFVQTSGGPTASIQTGDTRFGRKGEGSYRLSREGGC